MIEVDQYTEDELQELLRNRVEWVLKTPTLEVVNDMYAIRTALDQIAKGKKYAQALDDKFEYSKAMALAAPLTD
jgi:hypothetical protein